MVHCSGLSLMNIFWNNNISGSEVETEKEKERDVEFILHKFIIW